MRLSDYTDYSLRVLMHCAAHADARITIGGLAQHHGVSKNHLMKVVNDLARQGLLETTRGRGGGLRLLKRPQDIRIGDVVRASETDFRLVACFDAVPSGAQTAAAAPNAQAAQAPAAQACRFTSACRLKHLFGQALQAWFSTLDGATLADLMVGMPAPGHIALPLPQRPRTPAAAGAATATLHTTP